MSEKKQLTTSAGAPVADNQNSMTAGPRGPVLLQDYQLIEKLAHQNRERIPERPVHAKGWGAHGALTITNDITRYSKAGVFSEVGKQTPMIARFSTVAGELGAADAERDVRGFALKFYTEEGNWDMVGNNTPVFFVRDPYKFPDFIHTQKRHPRTNLRSPAAMWDFWSLSPESLHQVTILMSDRGLPVNVRHVNGYGSHTFSLINDEDERFWVKFHFKTLQGHRHWTNAEAAKVVGRTRESTQEDLYDAIENGDFPKWRFCVQVMPEMDAKKTPFNPFDLTKVWPHADYPLIEVGILELNRNPDNYFAEIEQLAFAPSNIVSGPPLPQGRPDAVLRQQREEPGRFLRAELVRRTGRGRPVPRAAAPDLGGRGPLQPPRGQRRLQPAPGPVPALRRWPARAPLQQHRRRDGRRAGVHHRTAVGALREGAPGVRRRRRASCGNPLVPTFGGVNSLGAAHV